MEFRFTLCAQRSSLNLGTATDEAIPIEEWLAREVTHWRDKPLAAPGTRAWNPAFNIIPASLVTALIVEDGVLSPPFPTGLSEMLMRADAEPGGAAAS